MVNIENARHILIKRYAKLSNLTYEKAKIKLENTTIDEIILKHEKIIVLSVILVVIVTTSLIVQFISLFYSNNLPYTIIANVLLFALFTKGLHDNYEIKNILKILKVIDLQ